jgi:hypothetical protein
MSIYRSSDSLSRCDQNLYSNIYDVRKRSDLKSDSPAATRSIHKDTIEISHDKLKEEALHRLRHTSKYTIAQNSFMRIGKYLFVAIAFPPYFAIYGLPKWLLVEGVPALFSMWVWMWKKIQHQSQKQMATGVQKAVQLTHFVQRLAQVLMQPFVHLALEIRQNIRRLRVQTQQMLRNLFEKGKGVLSQPLLKLNEGLKHLQKRLSQVREKWSQQVETITTRMQEGIQWVKQSPQIFLGWGQTQWQQLNQKVMLKGTHWKHQVKTSYQLAQRLTDKVFKEVRNGLSFVKKGYLPLIKFYQQQWLPRWQKVHANSTRRWEQAKEFFQQKHQRTQAFLQAKQEKLKHLTSQRLIHYFMSHPWMGKLPLRLQELLKKLLAHTIVRAICDKGVKIYSLIARLILRAVSYGLKGIAQGTTLIMRVGNWARAIINTAFQKTLAISQIGQRICLKSLLYSIYYSLLFTAITLILAVWGLRLLGEYMNSFTSKLHFKSAN